jgi:hypothetical protein
LLAEDDVIEQPFGHHRFGRRLRIGFQLPRFILPAQLGHKVGARLGAAALAGQQLDGLALGRELNLVGDWACTALRGLLWTARVHLPPGN